MPHISENDVEKLRGLLQLMRHEPEDSKQTSEITQQAYKILDGIQPVPQRDEVREAVAWAEPFSESGRLSPKEKPLLKNLIRAAQSAQNEPLKTTEDYQDSMDVFTYIRGKQERGHFTHPAIVKLVEMAKPHPAPVAQSQEVLSDAPCKKCGYNGVGYYQPDTHPCAATQNQPAGSAEVTDGGDLVTPSDYLVLIKAYAEHYKDDDGTTLQRIYQLANEGLVGVEPTVAILTTGAKK